MTTVNLNRPHYQESINKVLAYIEEHYKESEINLNEIAEHSNFCKRHVHKIMHANIRKCQLWNMCTV